MWTVFELQAIIAEIMVKKRLDLGDLGVGGEDRVKADVPVESVEYQAYLAALKERERLREENGGDTPEGVAGVQKSASDVDKLAQGIIQRERAN